MNFDGAGIWGGETTLTSSGNVDLLELLSMRTDIYDLESWTIIKDSLLLLYVARHTKSYL